MEHIETKKEFAGHMETKKEFAGHMETKNEFAGHIETKKGEFAGHMETKKGEFAGHGIDSKSFSLNGKCCYGRLVDIIDGDSLKIVIPLFDDFYKFDVRLQGIDAYEMRSKIPEIKDLAHKARDKVVELMCGEQRNFKNRSEIREYLNLNVVLVWIQCGEFDKYGRLLADVLLADGSCSVADVLIACNLAYAYNGKTKMTEEEQQRKLPT
jgi:endonuclease YncB( thermonuclease family)